MAGIEPIARKDFAHSNVIITEKKDRKASQFQLKDLPYPYTSKEQYEKSFEVPVGSEWNSRSGFQRGTLPRVVKKASSAHDIGFTRKADNFYSLEPLSNLSGDCSRLRILCNVLCALLMFSIHSSSLLWQTFAVCFLYTLSRQPFFGLDNFTPLAPCSFITNTINLI